MVTAAARRRMPAGAKLRVLVVDDSVVIRRLVTHALEEDAGLEVVGSASNGVIAMQRIPQLCPDVVTLDVEMPEMDGIETLRQIRKVYPDLVVIMFSTLTERGAAATIDALAAGANDYVSKAANAGSLDVSLANLRHELIPKIRQFFISGEPTQATASAAALTPAKPVVPRTGPRQAVVLGISTGGPAALAALMPMIPASFRLPVLIVQHMPAMFTRLLAERLNTVSPLHVVEAQEAMLVEPGQAYIAPGGRHMTVRRKGTGVVTHLEDTPPENSCRPSADVLFRSAAEVWGGGCIAGVLTGMGQDGLRGVEHLYAKGAYVIAQDEATSIVWGMPGAIVKAGLASRVLPLTHIASEILRQAQP